MKKRLSCLAALGLTICLLMTACLGGGAAAASESMDGPFDKYPEPLVLTAVRATSADNRTFMPGETWDDNIWTRLIEDTLNIKFDYIWTVASNEFNAKINLAIASDDLPDIMSVNYDIFYNMAKGGKLVPITHEMETLASPRVETNLARADGAALAQCTIEGELYGIASTPYPVGPMLWYRDDWAANVGITEPPETIDDVIGMMRKFATEDPNGDGSTTVGMGMDSGLFGSGFQTEGFFNAYGAYPTIWIENESGLVYGGIQEEAKQVLAKLQSFYTEGLIDPDFINLGAWAEAPDEIVKQKVGLAIAPQWFADWRGGDLMKITEGAATWTVMQLPGQDGEPVHTQANSKVGSVLCGSVNNKHPEALVRIANVIIEYLRNPEADGKYHDEPDPDGNIVNNFFHIQDFLGIPADDITWNLQISDNVSAAIESRDPSKLTDFEMNYYNRSIAYLDGTDLGGYNAYKTFGPTSGIQIAKIIIDTEAYLLDAYSGPNTQTKNKMWSALYSKQIEVYTRIIMGNDIETEWAEWVNFFEQQGGRTITEEINEWYVSR